MGSTTEGLMRQATSLASAGRSGGGTAAWTGGRAMTSTDFGLWKEGGRVEAEVHGLGLGEADGGDCSGTGRSVGCP